MPASDEGQLPCGSPVVAARRLPIDRNSIAPAAQGRGIAPGNIAVLLLILLVANAAGCLGPRRDDYQSAKPIALADPSPEADRVWQAIQQTLRRNRFRLDRVDRRAGVITTFPVTSQQFFEFWRHDVDTNADLWEATLNPIRRRVEVSVTRDEDNAWRELAVAVHKERLSSRDQYLLSPEATYQYFGDSLPSRTAQPRVPAESIQWLGLGRDPAMEEYLLNAILERVEEPSGMDDAETGD